MDDFFQGERLWPPGHRELQLYVLPDLERDRELAHLAAASREVLAKFPATAKPLPDEWLHMTLQPIFHGRHADTVDELTRKALIAELTRVVAEIPAFTMRIGSVLAYHSGAVADTDDGQDDALFDNLVDEVRRAVTAVCGPEAVTFDTRPAHMAFAYAADTHNSDPVQRLLRRVRPSHAPLTVAAVHLVEVEQRPDLCQFRWTHVDRIPLAVSSRREGAA